MRRRFSDHHGAAVPRHGPVCARAIGTCRETGNDRNGVPSRSFPYQLLIPLLHWVGAGACVPGSWGHGAVFGSLVHGAWGWFLGGRDTVAFLGGPVLATV